MSKKRVTIELYNQEGAKHYAGRCIGLLTDKEFNAVVAKPELQRKLMTVRTIPLTDIANVKKVQDLRLAIVTETDFKKTTGRKGLFITEPIELVSQFTSPDDLTLVGTEGSYVMIKETEVS